MKSINDYIYEGGNKSSKKAYLVYSSFVCRVVAPNGASEDEIAELAAKQLIEKINNGEFLENMENYKEDKEVPYDAKYDN